MKTSRKISLISMGSLYVFAGVMHFVAPSFYMQIMPPFLPWHLELVYLSGVAEIALGVGVLLTKTRTLAAWGVVALLIAVYPANIYMAVAKVEIQGLPSWLPPPGPVGAWLRLPLQFLLIYWAYTFTRPEAQETQPA